MAKDIVCVFASFKTCNNRQVTRVLGVDCRNIKKVVERRCILDTNGDVFWVNKRSVKHGNGLSEAGVQQIMEFWILGTMVLPNAKDTTYKRIGVKQYKEHATHYLQISQVKFFVPFLNKLLVVGNE
jgi:hypothetical protein